jgi:hypothetical protein
LRSPPATRQRRSHEPAGAGWLGWRDAPGLAAAGGADCSAKIARYRAVQDNDLPIGHVVQSVHIQIKREKDATSGVCADGREAEARSMVVASQKRHGLSDRSLSKRIA